jgi:multidrug efflux pump subunit AcrA (membrane-fusion protein)
LLIGITLAVSASFVVAGCGKSDQQAQMQGVQVKVMQVMQQDTPLTSEFAGQIVGKDEVKVQTKVSGNVVEKFVQGGQWVEAGQPLYRIDDRQYTSAVWQAQAKLGDSCNLSFDLVQIDEKMRKSTKPYSVASSLGIEPRIPCATKYRLDRFAALNGIEDGYEYVPC